MLSCLCPMEPVVSKWEGKEIPMCMDPCDLLSDFESDFSCYNSMICAEVSVYLISTIVFIDFL